MYVIELYMILFKKSKNFICRMYIQYYYIYIYIFFLYIIIRLKYYLVIKINIKYSKKKHSHIRIITFPPQLVRQFSNIF